MPDTPPTVGPRQVLGVAPGQVASRGQRAASWSPDLGAAAAGMGSGACRSGNDLVPARSQPVPLPDPRAHRPAEASAAAYPKPATRTWSPPRGTQLHGPAHFRVRQREHSPQRHDVHLHPGAAPAGRDRGIPRPGRTQPRTRATLIRTLAFQLAISPPLSGRPRHVVAFSGPGDRPALFNYQPRQLQTGTRGQGCVSVGHEDLLALERFLDSSTPRPEVFAYQDHSARVITRPQPTCPVSTARAASTSAVPSRYRSGSRVGNWCCRQDR
jgi:hypothetical protein